eukprot:scaffold4030_cov263-Pinguiococcus_pyrenoidosus.AAC.3
MGSFCRLLGAGRHTLRCPLCIAQDGLFQEREDELENADPALSAAWTRVCRGLEHLAKAAPRALLHQRLLCLRPVVHVVLFLLRQGMRVAQGSRGICVEAQESRAVALLSEKELDFCFDEPLKAATDKHVALQKKLLLPAAADDMETSPPDEASQGSWREHWDTLSAFSKRLLLVEAALFVASCLFAKSSTNALILLLSTIQPAVILYAVWWRSNRLDAEADLVVKYFSVGFFWTVLASAVVEVPVLLVGFALYFGALRDRPDFAKKMGDDGWAEELLEDLGTVDMAFIAFYVSFVVAAVVEEALKYAIVRFCPVSSGSSSPGASGFMARKGRKALGSSPSEIRPSVHKATLIYFVVGALGFTLSETIQAVVNKAKAPKFGDDVQLDLRIW